MRKPWFKDGKTLSQGPTSGSERQTWLEWSIINQVPGHETQSFPGLSDKKSKKTLISCLKILGSFGEEGWKEEMMGSVFMCSISMGHRLGGDKGQQKNQKLLQG